MNIIFVLLAKRVFSDILEQGSGTFLAESHERLIIIKWISIRALKVDIGVAWDRKISNSTQTWPIGLYDNWRQLQWYFWKAFLEVFAVVQYFKESLLRFVFEPESQMQS